MASVSAGEDGTIDMLNALTSEYPDALRGIEGMTPERFDLLKREGFDDWQDYAKKMSERSEASKKTRVQEVPNDPAVGSCCRILSYTLTQLFAKSLESRHSLSLPFSFVWAGASAARAM